jgi:hypothetical protein
MKRSGVYLIALPKKLRRADLERRRPALGRFRDLTGAKYDSCEVLGFAGFLGPFSAWLCICKCGKKFLARGPLLKYNKGQTCGCANAPKPKKRQAGASRQPQVGNKSMNKAQWAKEAGVSRQAMHVRVKKCLKLGLNPAVAVELKPREQAKKRLERDTVGRRLKDVDAEPLPPV